MHFPTEYQRGWGAILGVASKPPSKLRFLAENDHQLLGNSLQKFQLAILILSIFLRIFCIVMSPCVRLLCVCRTPDVNLRVCLAKEIYFQNKLLVSLNIDRLAAMPLLRSTKKLLADSSVAAGHLLREWY